MTPAASVVASRNALGSEPRPSLTDIFVHGSRLLSLRDGDTRIAIMGSMTTDLLARAAAVAAVQEGLTPIFHQAPFGAWHQEALDPTSALHRFKPDLVVIALDWRDGVVDLPLTTTAADVEAAVASKVRAIRQVWNALRSRAADCKIVQHLPAVPGDVPCSVADLRTPASIPSQALLFRRRLLDAGDDVTFLDADGLPADPSAWFAAKLPFGQNALPDYVSRFRSCLRQVSGRAKKVLALDLDNTLWGGVIGDDGVDALLLGPESPRGEAFSAFQKYVRALSERGVVLAVCSKNDPEIAEAGFLHPHSVLLRSDFQAFECNWSDKASALRRIARALNLGTDSIVFADDNPAECALVSEAEPDITVVALGDDPAEFVTRIERGRWFESQHLSAEDMARSKAYRARADAAAELEDTPDLTTFLRGLKMHGAVSAADASAIARVAQLEGKTNQFNLMTRRHSQAAIKAFAERDDAVVLAATLSDKFGEHGLVSSLVALIEGDKFIIDNWLMSCRVFSRTLEQFIMRHVVTLAASRGLIEIVGQYRPTSKNGVVADLYDRLGFEKTEDHVWSRAVAVPVDDLVSMIADTDA